VTTLVIHTPKWRVRAERVKSFDQTLSTGIGDGYAIPRAWAEQCQPGCKVVVLSKDEKKRAEGRLVRLVPVSKADNGLQRYDVHICDLVTVTYVPESLYRTGVSFKREQ
jgi:hypothetical protein